MLTLSLIAFLYDFRQLPTETGGVLFLGSQRPSLWWLSCRGPSIKCPGMDTAGILGLMGVLLQLSAANLINFIWPVALILVGVFMVVRTLIRK